jgi:rare lipoprotein A
MTFHTSGSNPALFYTLAVAGLLLGGCSWIPKGDAEFDVGIKDRGVASWYGEQFHGRQAANGEAFDMDALTAAHRTMPLGSIIRVVNLANGKHLHVRITDRGPYVNGRILDLSRAAAVQLDMERGGLAHVQITIVGHRGRDMTEVAQRGTASPLLQGDGVAGRPVPVMGSTFRVLPSDVWLTRRIRRVPAMLAADHTAHAKVPTLALV